MKIGGKRACGIRRTTSFDNLSELNKRDVQTNKAKRLRFNDHEKGNERKAQLEKVDTKEGSSNFQLINELSIDPIIKLCERKASLQASREELVKAINECAEQSLLQASTVDFIKKEILKLEAQISAIDLEIKEIKFNRENLGAKMASSKPIMKGCLTLEEQFKLGSDKLLHALEREKRALKYEQTILQNDFSGRSESELRDRLNEIKMQLETNKARRQRIVSYKNESVPKEFMIMVKWGSIPWKLE